jgi:6-pyruvoyltetrahydropterin/6-carboxytetrahydropterin synthase
MKVELRKKLRFEAAHHLPMAPEGHRCRNIHGHSYSVEIGVAGEVDPNRGWFLDYGDIAREFEPIRLMLDHKHINDVPGLESGTAESLAIYIFRKLKGSLPGLFEVTVRETDSSSCTYRGE